MWGWILLKAKGKSKFLLFDYSLASYEIQHAYKERQHIWLHGVYGHLCSLFIIFFLGKNTSAQASSHPASPPTVMHSTITAEQTGKAEPQVTDIRKWK